MTGDILVIALQLAVWENGDSVCCSTCVQVSNRVFAVEMVSELLTRPLRQPKEGMYYETHWLFLFLCQRVNSPFYCTYRFT